MTEPDRPPVPPPPRPLAELVDERVMIELDLADWQSDPHVGRLEENLRALVDADHDMVDIAVYARTFAGQAYRIGADRSDYSDQTDNLHHIRAVHGEPWSDPIPLDRDPAPPLPLEVLPKALREQVAYTAETRAVPPEIVYTSMMAVAAAVVGGHGTVTLSSTWKEPLNLWFLLVEESGGGKSPGTQPALDLARHHEDIRREQVTAAAQRAKVELAAKERWLKALTRKYDKQDSEAPDVAELVALAAEIERLSEVAARSPQLIASDITPEKLAHVLKANDEVIALIDDEGATLAHCLGLYSKSPNLTLLLKGYDGTAVTIQRVGGPNKPGTDIHLKRPLISAAQAVQPYVAERMIRSRELVGRGLAARFLPCLPQSKVGERTRSTMIEAAGRLEDPGLLSLPPPLEPPRLVFASDAAAVYDAWHDRIEADQSIRPAGVRVHVAKIRGYVLRIAALFAILDAWDEGPEGLLDQPPDRSLRATVEVPAAETLRHADGSPVLPSEVVTVDHVERAISLGEYHIEHAELLHEIHSRPEVSIQALSKKVTAVLAANPNANWSVSELRRSVGMHRRSGQGEQFLNVLGHLAELGWIRPADPGVGFGTTTRDKFAKVSPRILVNPAALVVISP